MTQEDAPESSSRESLLEHEGSAYDLEHRRKTSRTLYRRIKGFFSWHLVGFVAFVWPVVYMAYCWLVWKTSRVTDEVNPAMAWGRQRHGRVVALLWHQEVFTVAWAYRVSRGHTLASAGNFGRIITRMLERCNYTVFRGGSSTGSARKRRVLPIMIRHMRESAEPVVYGITVDGSNGPIYHLKPGMLAVAHTCRAPIILVRCWYKRRLELGTWDHTGVPLPWNDIHLLAVGPYWISPDMKAGDVERLRQHLELELLDLCALSYRTVDGPRAADFVPPGFPEGWKPRWAPGTRGLAFGPDDLKWDVSPPWASVPGVQVRERRGPADDAAGDDEGAPDAPPETLPQAAPGPS